MNQLRDQPRSGVARDDLFAGVRHLVAGSYLIFYRVEADRIAILRVLHGSRRIRPEDVTAAAV